MKNIQEGDLQLIELTNNRQSRLQILNLGASIFSFRIRDREANEVETIVGPRDPAVYISPEFREANYCFGASVGRYAGRISNGQFRIGDQTFQLHKDDNGVHLHGGKTGFQHRLWDVDEVNRGANPWVKLSYVSKDMEEGFPGELKVSVKYRLTDNDEIKIEYQATTSRDTIINLTNHTYFNLNGGGSVSDHFLKVRASKLLELNEFKLPTGNLVDLKQHPKSHMENRLLGNRELDDIFVLDSLENEVQAQLYAPMTGIKLSLSSNQPTLCIFTPEELPETWPYHGELDSKFPAVALEAENYPDAPNFRNFPSSFLKPGEVYVNRICFAFSIS